MKALSEGSPITVGFAFIIIGAAVSSVWVVAAMSSTVSSHTTEIQQNRKDDTDFRQKQIEINQKLIETLGEIKGSLKAIEKKM